jgi:hypothetical protein
VFHFDLKIRLSSRAQLMRDAQRCGSFGSTACESGRAAPSSSCPAGTTCARSLALGAQHAVEADQVQAAGGEPGHQGCQSLHELPDHAGPLCRGSDDDPLAHAFYVSGGIDNSDGAHRPRRLASDRPAT